MLMMQLLQLHLLWLVVLPRAGNIGGGGFTVLYNSSDKSFQSLDYREKAPLAASKNMYLDTMETLLATSQHWI